MMISYIFKCFLIIHILIDSIYAENVGTPIPKKIEDILKNTNGSDVQSMLNNTRRIIKGREVRNDRPYMVYLQLPSNSAKSKQYSNWICGGVIVHEEYILTSAACIEDAKHFYVVSGTYKRNPEDDRYNNLCIKNGAKKAVWKCVPKNYIFDGHENDNIRWLNNDIAIVKVEDEFDFTRKIRGCDFVPRPVCYNNRTVQLEKPGTEAMIAGWGSTEKYGDWISRRSSAMSTDLLETNVQVISKNRCKTRWGSRYHNIIDNYMICTSDIGSDVSEICNEKYVDCHELLYDSAEDGRKSIKVPNTEHVHSAHHNTSNAGYRKVGGGYGGFCENDHGGPLVYGSGANEVVIGIIAACLVKDRTNKCYGPFLYTSVWKNKNLISCAIYKDIAPDCAKLFRATETHVESDISWSDHPDGPAISEKLANNSTKTPNTKRSDKTAQENNK